MDTGRDRNAHGLTRSCAAMELVQNGILYLGMGTVVAWTLHRARQRAETGWSRLLPAALGAWLVLVGAGEVLTGMVLVAIPEVPELAIVPVALLPVVVVAAGARALDRYPRWVPTAPIIGLAALVVITQVVCLGSHGCGGPLEYGRLLPLAGLAAVVGARLWKGPAAIRPSSPWVPVALAVMLLPLGMVALAWGVDNPTPARQAWSAHVFVEGDVPFVVRVPFLVAAPPPPGIGDVDEAPAADSPALERIRRSLRVEGGRGVAALVEEGRAVEIHGTGPVRVRAETVTWGGGAGRLGFFTLGDFEVRLAASGPSSVAVLVEVATDDGAGSCARWQDRVEIPSGGAAVLSRPPSPVIGDTRGVFYSGPCQ